MDKKTIIIAALVLIIAILALMMWQDSTRRKNSGQIIDPVSQTPEQIAGNTNTVPPKDPAKPNNNNSQDQLWAGEDDLEKQFTSQNWTLVSIDLEGKRLDMSAKVARPLNMEFKLTDKSFGGFGGCNGFGGNYSFKAPYDFTFGPVVSTKMYCEGGASDLEQAYFMAMDKVSNVGIKGDQLVFADDKPNTTQLVFDPVK